MKEANMRYEKNRKLFGLDEYLVIKYTKLLAIPFIIVVLIVAVFLLDVFSNQNNKRVASKSTAFKMNNEIEITENKDIIDLLGEYQIAKLTADADKLYNLFLNPPEIEESMREKLKEEAKDFEYFGSNNKIYVADGAGEGEYVVYASMELKFKKAKNLAPMILQAYVVNEGSAYKFVLNSMLDEKQRERVDKINSSKKVQELYKNLNEELSKLVVDDVDLADKYKDFVEGELKFKDAKATKESLEAKKAAGEAESPDQEETTSAENMSDAEESTTLSEETNAESETTN